MNEFVFDRLVPAAYHGAVALLIAFAITRIFRKLPADSQAWIWRLAIGRFLLALVWELPVAMLPASSPSRVPLPSSTAVITTMAAQNTSVSVVAPSTVWDWHPLSWLWLLGTALTLAVGAVRWFQLANVARRGVRLTHQVRLSDEASVPFLVGNIIVLPSTMPAESRDIALAHEMAHRVRRDPLYSLPNFTVSALFWFVFPVWLALREYAIQVEIDCDRRALRLAGVSPRHYGSMLVALATSSTPPVGASAMAGTSTALSRRLTAMKNIQRPRTFATLALTLAAGALVLTPIRPVSAAAPLVQTAEVKQSQAKVEQAQRELAEAIASLNRALKKSADKATPAQTKERLMFQVQRAKADKDMEIALSRQKQREIEIRYKVMPVLTAPPARDAAAERARAVEMVETAQDWKQHKLALDQLAMDKEIERMRRSLESPDKQAAAQSLEDRIRQLEDELRSIKESVPNPGKPVAGEMPGEALKTGFSVAPPLPGEMPAAAAALPAQGANEVVLESAKMRGAPPIATGAGLGAPNAARTELIMVAPRDAIASTGMPGMAPPRHAESIQYRIVDDHRAVDTQMVTKLDRVSGSGSAGHHAITLQIAAGKNGTITVIENGKTRTVRVDPITHTVKVNGYKVIMDGKKTADGSYIIRLVHD